LRGDVDPANLDPTRDQLDDAQFLIKYFDTVNNKQYQTFFCQHNQAMMAKVLTNF